MSSRPPARANGSPEIPDRDAPARDEPDDESFDIGPGGDPRHPDPPVPPATPDAPLDDATRRAR